MFGDSDGIRKIAVAIGMYLYSETDSTIIYIQGGRSLVFKPNEETLQLAGNVNDFNVVTKKFNIEFGMPDETNQDDKEETVYRPKGIVGKFLELFEKK